MPVAPDSSEPEPLPEFRSHRALSLWDRVRLFENVKGDRGWRSIVTERTIVSDPPGSIFYVAPRRGELQTPMLLLLPDQVVEIAPGGKLKNDGPRWR